MKIKGNIAHSYRILLAAIDELPGQQQDRWIEVFRHGTLTVKLYAPRGTDPQTPHDQDEVYVIVAGTGLFLHGGNETTFGPGDMLFVAAGRNIDLSGLVMILLPGYCSMAQKTESTRPGVMRNCATLRASFDMTGDIWLSQPRSHFLLGDAVSKPVGLTSCSVLRIHFAA